MISNQLTVVAIKCRIGKHSLIRETGISPMEINLPPAEQAIIESLVSTGRFKSVDDVITEGVKLLATTETLRQKVQLGIDQADRDEVDDHNSVFERLRALAAGTSN